MEPPPAKRAKLTEGEFEVAELPPEIRNIIQRKAAFGNFRETLELFLGTERTDKLLNLVRQNDVVVAGGSLHSAWHGNDADASGWKLAPSGDLDIWIDVGTCYLGRSPVQDLINDEDMSVVFEQATRCPGKYAIDFFDALEEDWTYLLHPLVFAVFEILESMPSVELEPTDLWTGMPISDKLRCLLRVSDTGDLTTVISNYYTGASMEDPDTATFPQDCKLAKEKLGVVKSIRFTLEDQFGIELHFVDFDHKNPITGISMAEELVELKLLRPGAERLLRWINVYAFDYTPLGWLTYSQLNEFDEIRTGGEPGTSASVIFQALSCKHLWPNAKLFNRKLFRLFDPHQFKRKEVLDAVKLHPNGPMAFVSDTLHAFGGARMDPQMFLRLFVWFAPKRYFLYARRGYSFYSTPWSSGGCKKLDPPPQITLYAVFEDPDVLVDTLIQLCSAEQLSEICRSKYTAAIEREFYKLLVTSYERDLPDMTDVAKVVDIPFENPTHGIQLNSVRDVVFVCAKRATFDGRSYLNQHNLYGVAYIDHSPVANTALPSTPKELRRSEYIRSCLLAVNNVHGCGHDCFGSILQCLLPRECEFTAGLTIFQRERTAYQHWPAKRLHQNHSPICIVILLFLSKGSLTMQTLISKFGGAPLYRFQLIDAVTTLIATRTLKVGSDDFLEILDSPWVTLEMITASPGQYL